MQWNEIKTEEDIGQLMHVYGGFHDSCLTELHYISGACVYPDLSMQPVNTKRAVRLRFQRQSECPFEIELEFSGIECLHLIPSDDNYTCELLDCFFEKANGLFYWADDADFALDGDYDGTWVSAKAVKWRITKDRP